MANWKFYLDGNQVEEPIGWDAIEFTAIRMESHGIDQPFSTDDYDYLFMEAEQPLVDKLNELFGAKAKLAN